MNIRAGSAAALLLCLLTFSASAADQIPPACQSAHDAAVACDQTKWQQFLSCQTKLAQSCNYDLSLYGDHLYSGRTGQTNFEVSNQVIREDSNFLPPSDASDTKFNCGDYRCIASGGGCNAVPIKHYWADVSYGYVIQKCPVINEKLLCFNDYINCVNCQGGGFLGDNCAQYGGTPAPAPSFGVAGEAASNNKEITRPIMVQEIGGDGDCEYSPDGLTFIKLTKGTQLQKRWSVICGFNSNVRLDFGYGQIFLPETSGIRLDEFVNSSNIQKTQLFLLAGWVQARVNVTHTNTIRSDFSVTTPTCTASPRGTEMIVHYDNSTNSSTVYTTEGTVTTQGSEDSSGTDATTGQKVFVSSTGAAARPVTYTKSELAPQLQNYKFPVPTAQGGKLCPVLFIPLFAAAFVFARRR